MGMKAALIIMERYPDTGITSCRPTSMRSLRPA